MASSRTVDLLELAQVGEEIVFRIPFDVPVVRRRVKGSRPGLFPQHSLGSPTLSATGNHSGMNFPLASRERVAFDMREYTLDVNQ